MLQCAAAEGESDRIGDGGHPGREEMPRGGAVECDGVASQRRDGGLLLVASERGTAHGAD